jgi:hypothetical protein
MSNIRKQPTKQDQDNQQHHQQQPQQQKTRREDGLKKQVKDLPQYHDHELPETRLTR